MKHAAVFREVVSRGGFAGARKPGDEYDISSFIACHYCNITGFHSSDGDFSPDEVGVVYGTDATTAPASFSFQKKTTQYVIVSLGAESNPRCCAAACSVVVVND